MKKPTWSLAPCLLSIVLVLPGLASAGSVINTFKSSSSGSTYIATSDTIQFEVSIVADAGVNYNTLIWSLTGDIEGTLRSNPGSGWAGVTHQVVNWVWHYTPPGGGRVDMGTNGRFSPLQPALPVPGRVSGGYGFPGVGGKTGDGIPPMVGTVTIHAQNGGNYRGGGFQYPGVDGFIGSGGADTVSVIGGDFYVNVPEPGSALLVAAGLTTLGLRRRPRP